jgi:transcriptional regulator with XRE-family HTH domain
MNADVGVKLRELRERRGVTLRELAARSGISHSAISMIERGKISPSIETLACVLDALGTNLAGFFVELQSTLPYMPFYRKDELIEIRQDEKLSFRMLGASHPSRQMLFLYETYEPGADMGMVVHTGQEGGIVVSGEVELTVAGRTRVLSSGDGYYFDSQLPHRFRNCSDEPSVLISALTPPTY